MVEPTFTETTAITSIDVRAEQEARRIRLGAHLLVRPFARFVPVVRPPVTEAQRRPVEGVATGRLHIVEQRTT